MSTARLLPLWLFVGFVVAAAAPRPAQGETLLRYKFEVGQKSRMVIAQEMQMKMVMQETPTLMTTTSTMEFDWEVIALDDQGVGTFTQTADRIRMKMQGPQGVMMEYDSQSDEKPEGLAAMIASAMGGMIGKSYVTKMDPQGNILEIKLPQGLAENMGKLPGLAQMGNMFTEEGMKGFAEIAVFPKDPLEPGDTWDRTTTVKNPMTGDMTIETSFRYVGSEVRGGRELEKIAMDVKMSVGEGGQVTMKLTDQSSEGTIYFDNALGQFVANESKMTMKMQMSVMGQQIEQEITTNAKTERIPQQTLEEKDN